MKMKHLISFFFMLLTLQTEKYRKVYHLACVDFAFGLPLSTCDIFVSRVDDVRKNGVKCFIFVIIGIPM